MLCSQTMGSSYSSNNNNNDDNYSSNNNESADFVDFTKYNTIIVPYCTQDIHLGSNAMTYENYNNDDDNGNNDYNNDGSSMTVYHYGANNIQFVLNWIYKNFPASGNSSLRHVAITGCSAGATPVAVLQQLIHREYNHFGNPRSTQISAIADSPVYLTPSYFLQHGLPNWNIEPILSKIGVPYEKFLTTATSSSSSNNDDDTYNGQQHEFPTLLMDYILRKGDKRNRWGFVSHTSDPVSLMYYQYMSGMYDNNDDANNDDANTNDYNYDNYGNNNNNYDDDGSNNNYDEDQWYTELTSSISYIESKHKNVDSFWMDAEGHCTFGFYYAMQEESNDFQTFASSIFKEDPNHILSSRPSVTSFMISFVFGSLLLASLVLYRIHRDSQLGGDISSPPGTTTTAAAAATVSSPIKLHTIVEDKNEINSTNTSTHTTNTCVSVSVVTANDDNTRDNSNSSSNNNNNNKQEGLTWITNDFYNDSNSNSGIPTRKIISSTINNWIESTIMQRRVQSVLNSLVEYPVTAGYAVCLSMYFISMMIQEGFAHPVNNPSFGPNAIGLSLFGINNPALIVYQHQWYRLFISNFMVSGIITYLMAMIYIWYRVRKLESRMLEDYKSPLLFSTVGIVLATIINAMYCLIPSQRGASTTALPLLMGLQSFRMTLYWNSNTFLRPILSLAMITFDFFLLTFIFPLGNSYVMIYTACCTGPILALCFVHKFDDWLPGPMNVLKHQQQQQQYQQFQNRHTSHSQGSFHPCARAHPHPHHPHIGISLELSPVAAILPERHLHDSGSLDDRGISSSSTTSSPNININSMPGFYNTSSSNGFIHTSSNNNDAGYDDDSYQTMDDQRSTTCPDHNRTRKWKYLRRVVCVSLLSFLVMLIIPLFVTIVAIPDKMYVESFYTGCKSFYTTDINDLSASSFLSNDSNNESNNNGDDKRRQRKRSLLTEPTRTFLRWLAGEDEDDDRGDYECAEFCIPHIAVPIFRHVLRKKNIPIYRGQCIMQDGGIYSTHVLDKTFSAFSYSLDVELHGSSYSNN